MFIIPDEVLNKLVCSVCTKYLSVKPVKIYQGGIIKCGRCSHDEDDGVVSMYANITEQGLFPCINRYEGCKQLLTHSEVKDHEKECISRFYSCPECPSSTDTYTAYHLILHYKTLHPSQVLEKAKICIGREKELEKCYMYNDNDCIFILYVKCNLGEQCFRLNASNLGPPERISRVVQFVKCYLEHFNDKKLFYQTPKRGCTPFDNNSESFRIMFPKKFTYVTFEFCFDRSAVNNFYSFSNIAVIQTGTSNKKKCNKTEAGLHNDYPKMYLSEQHKKQYPNNHLSSSGTKLLMKINKTVKEFPRICDFCENIFPISNSSVIFTCDCRPSHMVCQTCYSMDAACCNTTFKELKIALTETGIYKSLYFYCRWGCRRFYCGADLRYHEDHCKDNVDAQVTLDTLALKHFKFFSGNKNHIITRSNLFSFREYNFTNCTKVFVITRDYFKFVLHCSCENKMYHFWVSHDYPSAKYYVLFRIRDKIGTSDYFRVNTFSLSNSKNSIVGFAVLLRKICE